MLVAVLAAACTRSADRDPVRLRVGEVEFARPAGSGEPNLHATSDGGALLTWLEPNGGGVWALRLAMREDGGWTEPITVRESDRFFVNWADFPSSVEMRDGTIAVHWLERVADAPYAYHVMLSLSTDRGATWSEPIRAHDDASPTEHGFVSMVRWEDGAAVTWLDGRAMTRPPALASGDATADGAGHEGPQGAMSVRFRTLLPDGRLGAEVLLDGRTCECCQTSLVRSGGGLVAAYRDRSEDEIRDVAVVRGLGERWTEPVPVAAHGWKIAGCPVNGPQLSAAGPRVAAAWYTGVGGEPRVYGAFSANGGESFDPPIRIDEGLPVGRVDIELLDDGTAIVTWLEGSDGPRILARRIGPGGESDPPVEIARTSGARSSGFPRVIRLAEELLVAWTLPGDDGGVRVRPVRIED